MNHRELNRIVSTAGLLWFGLLLFGCSRSDPTLDFQVDPEIQEQDLEMARIREKLSSPPVSIRFFEEEPKEGFIESKDESSKRRIFVSPECIVEPNHIKAVYAYDEENGHACLGIHFTPEGAERLAAATDPANRKGIALIVEGRVETAAKPTSKIEEDLAISLNEETERARGLKSRIQEHLDSEVGIRRAYANYKMSKQLIAVFVVCIFAIAMIVFVFRRRSKPTNQLPLNPTST